MAKNSNSSAAIAKPESPSGVTLAAPVSAPVDWLGDHLGDLNIDVTGTETMGAEDVRLPTWALNAKSGKNAETGRAVAPDEFWNTVTEKAKPKLRLIVLTNHKSREWRAEDEKKELVTFCRSTDGVKGTMRDGTVRACEGCRDYMWEDDPKTGKRGRRCGDVYNILGIDRETQEIGIIRMKKAAVKDFRGFYQKHFYKKRISKGRLLDVPYFAFETVVEAEERRNDKYTWYVPRFTVGGLLPKEEIAFYAELLKSFLAEQRDRLVATVESDDENVIDVPTDDAASFNTSDFADPPGPGAVIDASGEDASGNRF